MSHETEPGDPEDRGVATPHDVPAVSAEDLVAGQYDPNQAERRHPSTLGGACYLTALALVLVGLAVVVFGYWRAGVWIIGGTLLGAAVARTVLPVRDAGMLAVRNKPIDVLLLVTVGGVMIFLAASIPNQPGP